MPFGRKAWTKGQSEHWKVKSTQEDLAVVDALAACIDKEVEAAVIGARQANNVEQAVAARRG